MAAHIYGTKYNPTDAQIKTWSVQRTLDPLVAQVCYPFMNIIMWAIMRRYNKDI
jgi:hypothetical protein